VLKHIRRGNGAKINMRVKERLAQSFAHLERSWNEREKRREEISSADKKKRLDKEMSEEKYKKDLEEIKNGLRSLLEISKTAPLVVSGEGDGALLEKFDSISSSSSFSSSDSTPARSPVLSLEPASFLCSSDSCLSDLSECDLPLPKLVLGGKEKTVAGGKKGKTFPEKEGGFILISSDSEAEPPEEKQKGKELKRRKEEVLKKVCEQENTGRRGAEGEKRDDKEAAKQKDRRRLAEKSHNISPNALDSGERFNVPDSAPKEPLQPPQPLPDRAARPSRPAPAPKEDEKPLKISVIGGKISPQKNGKKEEKEGRSAPCLDEVKDTAHTPGSLSEETFFSPSDNSSGITTDAKEESEEIEKKLADIRTRGTLEDDERLYEMISKTIEKLRPKKDFDTIKTAMQLDIARKYVQDFIELRKALHKRTKSQKRKETSRNGKRERKPLKKL